MDVKYIRQACYFRTDGEKNSIAMLKQTCRESFICPCKEHGIHSTLDFVKRSFLYFGYASATIQTDNGREFSHFNKTNRVHLLDRFCEYLRITHKPICSYTPWHNGKAERSRRFEQERFCFFYAYDDLLLQMNGYMRHSNRILMAALGWKLHIEKRRKLKNGFAAYGVNFFFLFRSHVID